MNVLILGQNTKLGTAFSHISDSVYMVNNDIQNSKKQTVNRTYEESSNFQLLSSTTDITSLKNVLKRTKEIIQWVREFNIDTIFSNEKVSMVSAYLASKVLRKKILLLATSHDSRSWQNDYKIKMFSQIIKFTTHGYICLASFVYNKLIANGLDKERLLLLPNKIDGESFIKKESYFIDKKNIRLVYIAVVYPGKGQDAIVDILSKLDNSTSVSIDFYGDIIDEEFHQRILEKAHNFHLENKINFKGRIDNSQLRQILHKYDIYVCLSQMEMSPYNILEAKAAGLPIVSSNVGGIPDLVRNGDDGILVNRETNEYVSSLANLITHQSLREKIGRNSVIYSSENTLAKSASSINSFIQRILF